jgi:hypothetical protein
MILLALRVLTPNRLRMRNQQAGDKKIDESRGLPDRVAMLDVDRL